MQDVVLGKHAVRPDGCHELFETDVAAPICVNEREERCRKDILKKGKERRGKDEWVFERKGMKRV
jgi:hypothetical protein